MIHLFLQVRNRRVDQGAIAKERSVGTAEAVPFFVLFCRHKTVCVYFKSETKRIFWNCFQDTAGYKVI